MFCFINYSGVPDVIKYTVCITFLQVLMSSFYIRSICMCGLTSGLAAADMTETLLVRGWVDEPGELADLDKTELCRHRDNMHR